MAVNGGMAHIYLRNRQSGTWSDGPRWNEEVLEAALALSEDDVIRRSGSIYVRDARTKHDWNAD